MTSPLSPGDLAAPLQNSTIFVRPSLYIYVYIKEMHKNVGCKCALIYVASVCVDALHGVVVAGFPVTDPPPALCALLCG